MKAVFPLLYAACLLGCSGAARPPAAPDSAKAGATAPEVKLPRTVITAQGASNVPELLRDAAALAAKEQWRDAAVAYDRVYRIEPEGESGDEALWGAADADDHANDVEAALSRYELFIPRQLGTARAREARVRAARLLTFLGRFERAGVHADVLLKKLDELGNFERIAVLSAKALALVAAGDEQQASYFIEKGRDVVETNQLDAAGRVPRDLAQLYYALGETRRLRAERITFEPMPANFGAVLEARCQLLLDAQSAYSDSMRAYDAHWSAMAGYRIAELYQNLHQDLLAVHPPASADTERKQQLFEGAVRTRYAILLTKAHGMAEHTLAMAARTGEQSEWVERTRQALISIDRGVADEQAALAKLPYTQADFEAYFAEMEAAASRKGRPGAAAPKRH
jgi:hypothetical protein